MKLFLDKIKPYINKVNGVFVDIGTGEGIVADFILSNNLTCKLYCIDPFTKYPDYEDSFNQKLNQRMYLQTNMKLKSKYGDRIIFIKKFSNEAKNDVPDRLDLIYIESNPKYKYVLDDVTNWFQKLTFGGVCILKNVNEIDDQNEI